MSEDQGEYDIIRYSEPKAAPIGPYTGPLPEISIDASVPHRKTPIKLIKVHPAKSYPYISWHHRAAELDKLFGSPALWDFEITDQKGGTYREKRRDGSLVELEEIVLIGYIVAGPPGNRVRVKQTFGTAVRRQDMAYGDALKAAQSDAINRGAILLGIYPDVAGDLGEIPTSEQVAALESAVRVVGRKITPTELKAIFTEAGCASALNEDGTIKRDGLTRDQLDALLPLLAERMVPSD